MVNSKFRAKFSLTTYCLQKEPSCIRYKRKQETKRWTKREVKHPSQKAQPCSRMSPRPKFRELTGDHRVKTSAKGGSHLMRRHQATAPHQDTI